MSRRRGDATRTVPGARRTGRDFDLGSRFGLRVGFESGAGGRPDAR
jgi:hypothetical protein